MAGLTFRNLYACMVQIPLQCTIISTDIAEPCLNMQEHATQSFLEVLSSHLGGNSCESQDSYNGSSRDTCLLGDLRPYFITNVSA